MGGDAQALPQAINQTPLKNAPHTASSLLAADCLDALQLTLCPLLLGGPHHWLPSAGLPLQGQGWRLEQCRPLGGDELLLRYRRTPAL